MLHSNLKYKAIQLVCLCQKPYDPSRFMVGCTECDGWFHASCVNMSEKAARALKLYVCPMCDPTGKRLKCTRNFLLFMAESLVCFFKIYRE